MLNLIKIFSNFFFITLLLVSLIRCDSRKKTDSLFEVVTSEYSRIHFKNDLVETEDFNIIEYLYFYNGGGVAIGDINHDGLADIYFSSNQQSNQLYLNKGDFVFEDITETAGVGGAGNWKTGVAMVDIDGDGWLDIFSCGVGNYKKFNGRNQLLINNHNNTFTDVAESVGVSFMGFSTQAAFFDYDLDGDIDIYLANHSIHTPLSYGKISNRLIVDSLAGDKLYRNELNQLGILKFTDVTTEAGIFSSSLGYALSVGVGDFNCDGWPDLYVSNDFSENDYLYLNKQNGTFQEQSKTSLKHTSRFSMGHDVADINNDSLLDVVTLDMRPYEEKVIKTTSGEDNYEIWKFKLSYGFQPQVSRNTIQLNQGPIDSGRLVFFDIAQLGHVAATDWSWCPLIFDADGDGNKDIFISNGILRRPNNMDYISYISSDSSQKILKQNSLPWINLMPEGSNVNFFFKGNGNLEFKDVSQQWGFINKDFSNGAAYGDLDNDGDPDLVINRVNQEPAILRNNSRPQVFVKVTLEGTGSNKFGVGSKIRVAQAGSIQYQELYPSRGWESSSDYKLTFGINPKNPAIVTVVWPDGKISEQKILDNSNVVIRYNSAKEYGPTHEKSSAFLRPKKAPLYFHTGDDFDPFTQEPLIPFSRSDLGPPLTATSSDGKEQFLFVGGSVGNLGQIYSVDRWGNLSNSKMLPTIGSSDDTDATFLDVDGDTDDDLFVVAGGGKKLNDKSLVPRLYINQGGNFVLADGLVPEISLNSSCVRPQDYDGDGDVDVFIGGAILPFFYGMPPPSYLLENVGGRFIINQIWASRLTFDSPVAERPGMITDAVWSDINGDKLPDLVLVGQWMSVTILIQDGSHRFVNQTSSYGLNKSHGLWNCLIPIDVDSDGDTDFVAGNLGLNTRLQATEQQPIELYVGDFDFNGGSDQILVYFNGPHQYPFITRDQLLKQIPTLKRKFLTYEVFGKAQLSDIIDARLNDNFAKLKVQLLESSILFNEKGKFKLEPLPMEAQFSSVYAILATDLNNDRFTDLVLGGNQTQVQPEIGPNDASAGIVLLNNGHGIFRSIPIRKSGFYAPGNIRSIRLIEADNNRTILVGRNSDSLLSFEVNR